MIRHIIIIITVSIYVISSTYTNNLGYDKHNVFVCKSGMDPPREEVFSPSDLSTRSFFLNRTLHWHEGVVPYTMDRRFTRHQRWMILNIMHMFGYVSCVRWVPWTYGYDRVSFIRNEENEVCEADVGHRGGEQTIKLGDNCFDTKGYPGAIMHEMMHTLGFIHEHQRLDSKCYVRINTTDLTESPGDFAIIDETDTSFPYDFNSIMHYGTASITAYSRRQLGNLRGVLTDMDIFKLNYLYCGGPTFCERFPRDCRRFEELRKLCTSTRLRRRVRRMNQRHNINLYLNL